MNFLLWLNPARWLLLGGLVAALWLGVYTLDKSRQAKGYDRAQGEYMAKALKASEAARAKEAELQNKVTKVANDYQAEKRKRVADAVVSAGRLRDLSAVIADAHRNTPATAGADGDPRLDVIAECARTAQELDTAIKKLAGQTVALQNYADALRVVKP